MAEEHKGGSGLISQSTVDSFNSTLRGQDYPVGDGKMDKQALVDGDPNYDDSIRLLNSRILVRPQIVVRATGTYDVVQAIKFARANELEISVRSGGHHPAGFALCSDLTLDLSLMRGVHVQPSKQTVTVEGGCRAGDIDVECEVFGMLVPLGFSPATGMGLVLGGGVGIASRVFGLTVDSLQSAIVVTAEGEVIKTSKKHNPELLWALRGAGANFGVVTHCVLSLAEAVPFHGGSLVYTRDALPAVLGFMKDIAAQESQLGMTVIVANSPTGPICVVMIAFFGSMATASKDRVLSPLRDLSPVQDTIGSQNYHQMQRTLLPFIKNLAPFRQHWQSGIMSDMTDTFVTTIGDVIDRSPRDAPFTMVVIELWGGAIASGPDAPVGIRSANFSWAFAAGWPDEVDDDAIIQSVDSLCTGLQSLSQPNVYANYSMCDDGLAASVGGTAALRRLREIKGRYDPDNFFSSNFNISPN